MTKERFRSPEGLAPEERLKPGSKILYVIDGTDNIEDGGLTNGVKTTSIYLQKALREKGYLVDLLYPDKREVLNPDQRLYRSVQLPGYPGFEVVTNGYAPTRSYIDKAKPDGIYVASADGPLGISTSLVSAFGGLSPERQRIPFVASYTTRLDHFISGQLTDSIREFGQRLPQFAHSIIENISVSPEIFQGPIRAVYSGADRIMVPTQTMIGEMIEMGFDPSRIVFWPRGIDKERFYPPSPDDENPYLQYEWYRSNQKPIVLFFGRVSLEKNIEALLRADLPDFHKVIIGKGPHLEKLKGEYQKGDTHFLGPKYNEELAGLIRFAHVHAFTSLSDTFGNTILEAGASGVPTVGFAGVPGPQDIIIPGLNGYLATDDEDFSQSIAQAALIDSRACAVDITTRYSWEKAADQLLAHMRPTHYYQK